MIPFERPFSLTAEQRQDVRRHLEADFHRRRRRRTTIETPGPDLSTALEKLCCSVEHSILVYRESPKYDLGGMRLAETYRAMTKVYDLSCKADPPIGEIRARIRKLPPMAISYLEERTERWWPTFIAEWVRMGLLPKGTPSDLPANGFVDWCQTASRPMLCDAIEGMFTQGFQRVVIKTRSKKTPVKVVLKPIILGVVAGGGDKSPHQLVGGRPDRPETNYLIPNLAVSWWKCTSERPRPNRSDKPGFSGLVHDVFQWLELDNPEQALRRYWDIVKSAEITRTEHGVTIK